MCGVLGQIPDEEERGRRGGGGANGGQREGCREGGKRWLRRKRRSWKKVPSRHVLPGSLSSTWWSGGAPRGHHIDLALTDTCWRGFGGGLVVMIRRWCGVEEPPLASVCSLRITPNLHPSPSRQETDANMAE